MTAATLDAAPALAAPPRSALGAFLKTLCPPRGDERDDRELLTLVLVKDGKWPDRVAGFSRQSVDETPPEYTIDDIIPLQTIQGWTWRDFDIYFRPAPMLTTDGEATRDDLGTHADCVWIDSDDGYRLRHFANFDPAPTFIVQTSPDHYHCYWCLAEPLPMAEVEILNRQLIAALGLKTDTSCWNANRWLRLPGSLNHKHNSIVELAVNQPDRIYSLADFAHLPTVPERTYAAQADSAGGPSWRDRYGEPDISLAELKQHIEKASNAAEIAALMAEEFPASRHEHAWKILGEAAFYTRDANVLEAFLLEAAFIAHDTRPVDDDHAKYSDPRWRDVDLRRFLTKIESEIAAGTRKTYQARTGGAPHMADSLNSLNQCVPPLPFPVDALPPTMRAFVEEGAAARNAPPEYIAVPLLAFAGAAIGTGAVIEIKRG